nr:hypothetical protein Hi04_10k_c2441A_00023 [uncultured bacterium]UXE44484.1 hypothetical protein Hi04_10k_c2441B_00032 [uncultured bacterium]
MPAGAARSRLAHPVSLASLVLVVWSIPWIVLGGSTVVSGTRYFFLADDPTISMRYGRNLAHGLGLVWNAGERVEGYSNFLWTAYMGLLHLLPLSNATTALPVMLSNIALAALGAVFAWKIARRLDPDPRFSAIVVFAYALNGDLFEWMIRGFETSLLATWLLAAFYLVWRDLDEGRARVSTFFVVTSMSLVRIDGMLLSGLLLLWILYGSRDRKRAVLLGALALMVPLAHIAWRWSYYGYLLPNTAYLKMYAGGGRLKMGIRWTARFVATYPVAIALLGVLLLRSRTLPMKVASIICVAFFAYVTYAGGDIFVGFRLLAPVVPLLVIVGLYAAWHMSGSTSGGSIEERLGRLMATPAARWLAIVAGGSIFAIAAYAWQGLSTQSSVKASAVNLVGAVGLAVAALGVAAAFREASGRVASNDRPAVGLARAAMVALVLGNMPLLFWSHRAPQPLSVSYPDNVRIGLFLHDHIEQGVTIADTWAGLPPYFSERPSIDLLGKCDARIAHGPVAGDGLLPGHNKFDYDYALGELKPAYVVAAFRLPVTDEDMRQASHGDLAFIGHLYFNETFRRHCLPHPEPMEGLRTLFRCEWSEN